jgi:hypothetical protein
MAFEYLFSALPALPADPGSNVTLAPTRLAKLCAEEGGRAAQLVGAILMEFDVRALELMEFGAEPSETALYSEAALRDRQGFPEWLVRALARNAVGYAYGFDRIWEAYFEEMMRLARAARSTFFMRWVRYDAGLRNAVSKLRAQRSSEPERAFTINAFDVERASTYRPVLDALISFSDGGFDAWAEMDRLLVRIRLAKLRELAPAYSFNLDELLSYAAQYVLLRGSRYLSR